MSDEWLRGRIGNREGIFPLNFVNIVVPLTDTVGVVATALYNFSPETWEDLELQVRLRIILRAYIQLEYIDSKSVAFVFFSLSVCQEGAKVLLLSRINNDWLYGECNGKRGQFPATFVDNVPSNLPMHS